LLLPVLQRGPARSADSGRPSHGRCG
jgi:hypothetical protein